MQARGVQGQDVPAEERRLPGNCAGRPLHTALRPAGILKYSIVSSIFYDASKPSVYIQSNFHGRIRHSCALDKLCILTALSLAAMSTAHSTMSHVCSRTGVGAVHRRPGHFGHAAVAAAAVPARPRVRVVLHCGRRPRGGARRQRRAAVLPQLRARWAP